MMGGRAGSRGRLERVLVRTVDGRVFDLGRPGSRLAWLRLEIYYFRRRAEFAADFRLRGPGRGDR